jgi:hypothetical protein
MIVRSLILCLVCSVCTFAQTGNYFLSHFSPDQERSNMVCFDLVQDDRGVFYFATQAGVLQFDGINWDQISTQSTIYAIERTQGGDIFVAGSNGFGKIEKNENGLEVYLPLYEDKDIEYVFQITVLDEKVYFLSDHTVFEYNTLSNRTTPLTNAKIDDSFTSLHTLFDKVIIGTESGALLEIKGAALQPISWRVSSAGSLIFSLPWKNQYILGTDDNRLFFCDRNMKITEMVIEDSTYVQASVLMNATLVNDELLAIGTLRGGIAFVNPLTGATREIINYNTGLPDNEVFSILTDRNLNVWAAHAYGFTRVSPYLPLRSFRYYPGLEGNLLCATTYQGHTYVGTSAGLFMLERQEFNDEITYYVDVPVRTVVPGKKATAVPPSEAVKETEAKESQKGGLFRFLKRKKNQPTTTADKTESKPSETTEEAPVVKVTTRREKRTERIFRSAFYAYKKVKGVEAKVAQLTHWRGTLIASGVGGAYEVDAMTAKPITEDPVRFLFASDKRNELVMATYDDKVHKLIRDKEWKESEVLENIPGPIQYIFEEDSATTWYCGFDKLYRVTNGNAIQKLDVANRNFDKILGVSVNNQIIVTTSSGFFYFDKKTQKLQKGDTLRKPVAYFAGASHLWFRDKHSWYVAGSSANQQNLQLLNLFSNLRFIGADAGDDGLWVITGNNELLHFTSDQIKREETLYPLILKSIQYNNILVARSYLQVDQNESSLVVEVVKPDYIGNRFVEYRYYLDGLHKEWTDWSTSNNIIKFPYLPSGDYTLKVESRDIFGRVFELSPVTLNVEPPYWKQTWFYAAEFSVFVFLVLLSFRLSYRFIFVSRILSLLSIIMFIEFIQTAAGEQFSTKSSPVLDFGLQVCVAFMILPVEGFLRRHLLQALARRNEARMKSRQEELEQSAAADNLKPEADEFRTTKAERSEII